jgi:SagB-type dehydrogenase family enzyme
VLYWQKNELVFENFASRRRISADPLVCSILDFCCEWRSLRDIASYFCGYTLSSVRSSLQQLCQNHLLERSDQKRDPRIVAMESWNAWNPAAGFFHFSTKDTTFTPDPFGALEEFKTRIKHRSMPLPVKNYSSARKWKLPRARKEGEFATVLRSRRTWRTFAHRAVSLENLAHVLELTFGIQGWVGVPGLGRAAMKTSPSGGCLHPIEAYVLVQRVNGIPRGLYHYNSARHQLEWINKAVSGQTLIKNLGYQRWFTKGAFLVLMTAVFPRTRWKYDFPRVYRAILLEAGHLCQTFCLTATWQNLAPFCTIAYTDTQWEKWLGIDGINESLLYIAGAGARPAGIKGAHLGAL